MNRFSLAHIDDVKHKRAEERRGLVSSQFTFSSMLVHVGLNCDHSKHAPRPLVEDKSLLLETKKER